MSGLFIEPLDVWLFRDGRPFTARDDHHARSLFPPSPFTLYGALRTKLLFDAADSADDLADPDFLTRTAGEAGDFTRFRVHGPLLARRGSDGRVTRYFAAPLDAGRLDPTGGGTGTWTVLRPRADLPGLRTDLDLALPWSDGGDRSEPAAGTWLAEPDFFATLNGEPPAAAVTAAELFALERRSGVELDWSAPDRPLRVTREGRLYSVDFVRPAPGVGLWVGLEGYDLPHQTGLMGLGGEARGSRYEPVEMERPDRSVDRGRVADSRRLKVVLATPAIFRNGWLPGWVDPGSYITRPPVEGLRLVSAATGRPQRIGGFDLRAGRPRPIRAVVPAGSVYWFEENQPGAVAQAFDVLGGREISDEYAEIGFGLCYAGGW